MHVRLPTAASHLIRKLVIVSSHVVTCNFCCSLQVSDTVVEPYNATLSVHQLVENADECVVRFLAMVSHAA